MELAQNINERKAYSPMEEDFIKSLDLIGYTARIRRLSDNLNKMGKVVYKDLDLEIEPNWHLVLLILEREEELTATEIAEHLSFSHTAIIKITKKMVRSNFLNAQKSPTDGRKQLYSLSDKAIKQLPKLKQIWNDIAEVHQQYVSKTFLKELTKIENSLTQKSTIIRVKELYDKRK
ncbi:MarR family transcriptional regulator [bacterium SCSIO 12741]|nr:MarR family transcriptional regulator [bacterium SCSIO 12741]